jgi:HEAT repeat protein
VHVTDKKAACYDLLDLIENNDIFLCTDIANAIGLAFQYIPEKRQVWNALHRFTHDKEGTVRWCALISLEVAFPYIHDRMQAWEDLYQLAIDRDSNVRQITAYSIGVVFPYVLDKKKAWNILNSMANDKDEDVRVPANYSLGRVSIFKAVEADSKNKIKEELEYALEFFGKAYNEATVINPAGFCLPFYLAFYAIIFKEQRAEVEVQKYLAEARSAVEGSESK